MRIVRNDELAGSTPVSSTKTPINTHFSTSHLAMDASGFTSGLPEGRSTKESLGEISNYCCAVDNLVAGRLAMPI
jgi:hypothetical protein